MAITFDAAYQQAASGDTSWSHTVGAGSYKILLVMCGMHSVDNITAVTFNGVSLTKLGEANGNYRRAQIWYLLNPPEGTYTVQLTKSGTGYNVSAGSISFFNVSQTSPFRHNTSGYGSSYSPSLAVTSLATDVVVDVVVGWTWIASVGAGQTLNWSDNYSGSSMRAHCSRETGTDPSTTMSWTASGSDGNYAMYAASLIENPGFVGSGELPSLTMSGGSNGAEGSLPVLSINAGSNGADLTLPLAYILNSWVNVPYTIVDQSLPMVIVDGDLRVGTVSTASLTLPSLAIVSFGVSDIWDLVNTVDEDLPSLTASSTSLTGEVSEGDCDVPFFIISATLLNGGISQGVASLPSLLFTGRTVNTGTASDSLPVFTINAYAHGPLLHTLDETLPLLQVVATLVHASTAFRCYVLNTENSAITEYDNFPFNSFCTFKGKHLAAGANGIVLLEGNKDLSRDIQAYLNVGNNDFDLPSIKRITDAYLSMKGDGSYYLTVTSDDGVAHSYLLSATTGDRIKNLKTNVGKGKKGRFFELELSNLAGADFELYDMVLNVELLKRNV